MTTTDTQKLKKGEGENASPAPLSIGKRIWAEIKFFAGLFVFLLFFLTLVWGHYKIPSESMQPTLEVGDHLYVSKFAYGYSRHSLPFNLYKLPFLKDGKVFSRLPKYGDVVVFRNPANDLVMIKRLVGLPGDTVQVKGGQLYLNNEIVTRDPVDAFLYREHKGRVVGVDSYAEQLPGEAQSHIIYEQTDIGYLDDTEVFNVPEGHVFFMGDNRDNSVDSRAPSGPGYVPVDHLMGRADLMMFSFKRCTDEKDLRCPPFRFAKKL